MRPTGIGHHLVQSEGAQDDSVHGQRCEGEGLQGAGVKGAGAMVQKCRAVKEGLVPDPFPCSRNTLDACTACSRRPLVERLHRDQRQTRSLP